MQRRKVTGRSSSGKSKSSSCDAAGGDNDAGS
eukprot:COSAG06_NODE_29335_length_558_cov_1.202614_2_plen_31_part_01